MSSGEVIEVGGKKYRLIPVEEEVPKVQDVKEIKEEIKEEETKEEKSTEQTDNEESEQQEMTPPEEVERPQVPKTRRLRKLSQAMVDGKRIYTYERPIVYKTAAGDPVVKYTTVTRVYEPKMKSHERRAIHKKIADMVTEMPISVDDQYNEYCARMREANFKPYVFRTFQSAILH